MDSGLDKHCVHAKFQFWSLYYKGDTLECLGGQGTLWLQLRQDKESVLFLLDSRFYLHIGLFPSTYISESPPPQETPHSSFSFFFLYSTAPSDRYAPPIPNTGSHNLGVLNVMRVPRLAST